MHLGARRDIPLRLVQVLGAEGKVMSEPYLILHRVRGEPAFDIAERWSFDGEEGWIIPTSGHRAYPVANWPMSDIQSPYNPSWSLLEESKRFTYEAVRDHYSSNDRPIREATYNVSARAAGLLAKLGLVSKVERRD